MEKAPRTPDQSQAQTADDWLGYNAPDFTPNRNKQPSKTTFNERYVQDFAPELYERFLSDGEQLKDIGNSYLKQYDPSSRPVDKHLAFKESLDHYVLKRFSEDPHHFADTPEFANYSRYIMDIAVSKTVKTPQCTLLPELATNPVLRNAETRKLVVAKAYPADQARTNSAINQHIENYRAIISSLERRMDSRNKLSQSDLNLLGDYVYAGKNFKDGVAKKYAEYCFNEIDEGQGIKPSIEMLGALTNYFAKCYTIDDDVRKNSRFIIATPTFRRTPQGGIDKEFSVGVSKSFGCVMEADHFLKMTFADGSLNKSRTNRANDIYRLMMISFHELTHDHQRNMMQKGSKDSSAMSYILNQILRRDSSDCYPVTDQHGNIVFKTSYYKANHDCDEIEIQADEESWRQCRRFLVDHRKEYAWRHRDKGIEEQYSAQRDKCKANEEEVQARRAFTRKVDSSGREMPYIQYDIENLKTAVRSNPALLREYPQLSDFLDPSGRLNPALLFNDRLADTKSEGFDHRTDNFGVEIGAYMVTAGKDFDGILRYIDNHHLSEKQVHNLTGNLWNIIRQNALKVRLLKNANLDNYDETYARRRQSLATMKDTFLRQYIMQLYNCVHITGLIKSRQPEMGDFISEEEQKYLGSYYGELSREGHLTRSFAEGACSAYLKTKNPVLASIAHRIKRDMLTT